MVSQRSTSRGGPALSAVEGFTLVEILLALGIMGMLVAVVMAAINPRKMFLAARDTERRMNARQVQNAMFQYMVARSQMLARDYIPEGKAQAKPICKEGVSAAECESMGRVNLQSLALEYVAQLPIDPLEKCKELTGYKIYREGERPVVFSAYLGMLLDSEVQPDCAGGGAPPPPPPGPPTCNGQTATIYVDSDNVIVGGPLNGQPYAGTLTGTNGSDIMVGTEGTDTVDGDSSDDTVCGLGGNDTLNSGGGNGGDTVFGGDGDDTLTGGNAKDTLCGGNGNDTVTGNNGKDELDGGAGTDTLNGGSSQDNCVNGETLTSCENANPVPACNGG